MCHILIGPITDILNYLSIWSWKQIFIHFLKRVFRMNRNFWALFLFLIKVRNFLLVIIGLTIRFNHELLSWRHFNLWRINLIIFFILFNYYNAIWILLIHTFLFWLHRVFLLSYMDRSILGFLFERIFLWRIMESLRSSW